MAVRKFQLTYLPENSPFRTGAAIVYSVKLTKPSEKPSTPKPDEDDPNRPETEEDAIRAEAVRRLQERRLTAGLRDPSSPSSPPPTDTPPSTD